MATSPDPADSSESLLLKHDFRSLLDAVRGKYLTRYNERLRVVRLANDVAAAFTDEAAVNAALREYFRNRTSEATSA